jgi:hypothetical protein
MSCSSFVAPQVCPERGDAAENIIWNIFCFRVLLLELQPVAVGHEQIPGDTQ